MISKKYSQGLLDFHTHSAYSDGGDTPTELVRRAKEKGVSALALTDHHTARGLVEFREACKIYDVFGIPFGMEISVELPELILTDTDNEAPDLVLLGKNVNQAPLIDYQKNYFRYLEQVRLPGILEKLKQAGFSIPEIDTKEECAKFHCPPDILMNFTDYKDNLDKLVKYIKARDPSQPEQKIRQNPFGFVVNYFYRKGCPAYIKEVGDFSLDDALCLADSMNCRIFIAHPGGDFGSMRPEILDYFVSKGVRGIEARNYYNNQEQKSFFDKYAKQNHLVRSGGSDYHGDLKKPQLGMWDRPNNQLPKSILEEVLDSLPN